METRTSESRNVIVVNLDAQRPQTHPAKENSLRGEDFTRSSTDESSERRPTDHDTPFSCRRWRRLTGKVPEPAVEIRPVVRLAQAPPHWSSSMKSKGFVSAFPSTPGTLDQPPVSPRSKGGDRKLQWKDIDRFEPRVMKKLVDKAYGINARHHTAQQFPLQHGNREAQRQFIRSQVYLPSVHRTLDYLEKAREVLPGIQTSRSSPPRPARPAPLGTKLLSSQLHNLQAELLVHYEADRVETAAASPLGLQHDGRLWSPQPPPHPPTSFQASSSSQSLTRNRSNLGSFRSLRRTHSKPSRDSASDSNDDDTATEEEVMVLTDSDTYSLSSGVEADSETDSSPRHDPAASESSGTASWCSLESHVMLALEGSNAIRVGSVREPLVVTYDSDDLVLFAESSTSSTRDASVCSGSTASLPVFEAIDDTRSDDEHVVFVDNGVRVNSSGQVMEENDLALALAMLIQDIDHDEASTDAESNVDVVQEEPPHRTMELQASTEVECVYITSEEELQQHEVVVGMNASTPFSEPLQNDVVDTTENAAFSDDGNELIAEDPPVAVAETESMDTVSADTRAGEEEAKQDERGYVSHMPVEFTELIRVVDEDLPSPENHEANKSESPEEVPEPTPQASVLTDATPEDVDLPHSLDRPRLSITSDTHYDDADFEDLEMNDAESDQGYESFED